VTLHWADLVLVVALAAAGTGIAGFFLLRRFEKMFAASQREMHRRLTALTESFSMHEPGSVEALPATDTMDAAEIEEGAPAAMRSLVGPGGDAFRDAESAALPEQEPSQSQGEIPPDIRVAITAAAIAAFGNHARVRSARQVPSSDVVSPWTQQGRVIVQSSHNLRTRG